MRKYTPWGATQGAVVLAPGIISYETASHRITRKTSKYNKYMKWHIECFCSGGQTKSI